MKEKKNIKNKVVVVVVVTVVVACMRIADACNK